MPSEPIVRRHFYSDPGDSTLHRLVDNNNVQIYDTTVRPLPTTYLETAINTGKYYEPLDRMHNSGPHGWGIATGLSITATLNQPGVKVREGIAIDVNGRLIALAQGGKAEIGSDANNDNVSPQLVDVLAAGADLPTVLPAALGGPRNGAFFVTITWCETLNVPLWGGATGADHEIPEMRHTPWLRLEEVANITDVTDDGSRIVLGRVQINAGNVTGLTHERRREVSLPAGTVRLLRGATTGSTAENIRTADIRARAAGGLELRVTEPAAQVDFYRDDGTNVAKTIPKVAFGADQIVARRGDGKETVSIDSTQANITLGTNGIEGDLLVRDAQNRLVITLDGHDAAVVVGTAGNEGDILVKDNAGQNSVRVDGNTGTVFTKRLAPVAGNNLDVDATGFRIHGTDLMLDGRSGGNKRALVDLYNKLAVNFANDYTEGVEINNLHLNDHIYIGQISDPNSTILPIIPASWVTLTEFDLNRKASEWQSISTCSFWGSQPGMSTIWRLRDSSYMDNSGSIIIKWELYYGKGTSNIIITPSWTVTWVAFRK
jgi:hypothetical protein